MPNTMMAFLKTHKIAATIGLTVIVGGGYYEWQKSHSTTNETRYVTALVQKNTLITSVTGSGQVSTSNQLDLKPKVSGDLVNIPVTAGQEVKAGTIIAQINASDALKAVRDAEVNLKSAQLSLAKLQQPPDQLSLLQDQNAIDRAKESKGTSQNDLIKSYDDAFNAISDTFTDLPPLMSDVKDIMYGSNNALGGNGQLNIDFYTSESARTDFGHANQLRDDVYGKYQVVAKPQYDTNLADYKATTRTSDQNTIKKLLDETYATTRNIADAVKAATTLIQYYQDSIKNANGKPATLSTTQLTALSTYTSQLNSHLSALLSAQQTIQSDLDAIVNADRTIAENTASLSKLQSGTDPLDIQSSQLTVEQRQNALIDAQTTLADYTIRAPFDGVIASVASKKGDAVGSGTTIATLVTKQEIAEISLNEVDAAKIAVGQKATITFDALPDLTITGVVGQIDTIGTVSQGVVTYTVKIQFDTQDARIKSGMSVSAAIITNVKQDVLTVSNSAIKSSGNNQYVEIFTPPLGDQSRTTQGYATTLTPTQHTVTTGLSNDTDTEIDSGLAEGDEVVVRTITATKATTAAAPSLFGSTGTRGLGGGTTRAVTGATGR